MDKIYISELFERNLDRAISTGGMLDPVTQAKKWTDGMLEYVNSKTNDKEPLIIREDDIVFSKRTKQFGSDRKDSTIFFFCLHSPTGIEGTGPNYEYARRNMFARLRKSYSNNKEMNNG